MTRLLALMAVLALAACASPTMKMSDQQIATTSDDQLCSYKNNYREEPRLNAELTRRGLGALECNPRFRQCMARGNQPGTNAMDFCMDVLAENDRLRRERDYYDNRAFLYGYPYRYHHTGVGVGLGF